MSQKPVPVQSIILADDDADDRDVFKDVIYEINPKISLEIVASGRSLMALLQHYAPDLLFLDLEMPYKNGLECLTEIRSNPKLTDLPVVVFSSTTRAVNIQTAYEMGAHLFLVKEASFTQYTEALKAILQLNWKEPETIRELHCINNKYIVFTHEAAG